MIDFYPASNAGLGPRSLARVLAVVAWGAFLLLMAIAAGLMLFTPWAGAAGDPLSFAAFATAIFLVLLAALARLASLAARRLSPRAAESCALFWPLALPGLLLAVAVPLVLVQNGSWLGALAAMGLVLGEQFATGALWRRTERANPIAGDLAHRPLHSPAAIEIEHDVAGGETDQHEFGPNFTQQVNRWHDEATGAEQIHAMIRGEARPGDAVVYLHLAICPAFAAAPSAQCEVVEGPEAEAAVSFAAEYGIRCEVRLREPVEETATMVIEIFAQEPTP